MGANTGIVVDDGAIDEFCSFKIKKGTRYGFITYKIDKENGKIVTDQKSESRTVQDLINALPEDDCRFAILDNDYKTHDGRDSSKLVMIAWSPDTAPIRSKMTYAGSKDAFGRAMVGISVKITATDLSELTQEIVTDACQKLR